MAYQNLNNEGFSKLYLDKAMTCLLYACQSLFMVIVHHVVHYLLQAC